MTLGGKVVIVTGGSRGIGRACVLEAVERGARVVFCSRQDGTDSRVVEREASERGGRKAAIGLAADVSEEASVERLFVTARDRYGRVDGVVHNAAISRERLLLAMTAEDWDTVIDTNLTSGFLVARTAVRVFLEQGRGGRIVVIGTLSQHGVAGNTSYAASKGGLAGLARLLAHQYGGRNIAAHVVIPGYVETALSANLSESAKRALIDGCPLRRAGTPGEIASVVAFLLSDEAAGLQGQVVFAAGGMMDVPL